jgi:glycosyltransferase involved in cell wall biosynthesis
MSQRLRVAQVTLSLDVGGQERLLVEMARHRDQARFEWTVITLGPRGTLADTMEALGGRVVAIDAPGGFRPGLWRTLSRMFRAEHYDVVHTHDDRPLLYGMPAAWWAGVRRRVHTHHHGHLEKVTWRQRFLLRQASLFAEQFVCVSQDSARYMIDQGVAASRVSTLWNGIDLTQFAYSGPCDDGPIVTVARLSPEKDIANLVRAARIVVDRQPHARFEIAGDGASRADLERLARELNLTTHITFLGEMRDIPSLLGRARLFVLPSLTEGISLTLLEAMARGLPVVTTAVGGNPEVVEDERTGLLVPARDAEKLANAILGVVTDPDWGRRMGQAGRQRVEEHFDIRKMTAAYEAMYDAPLSPGTPGERGGRKTARPLPSLPRNIMLTTMTYCVWPHRQRGTLDRNPRHVHRKRIRSAVASAVCGRQSGDAGVHLVGGPAWHVAGPDFRGVVVVPRLESRHDGVGVDPRRGACDHALSRFLLGLRFSPCDDSRK